MRAAVAFVVPTTHDGLERRGRALRSLLAQSDPDWVAVAVGEGVSPYLPLEARYYAIKGRADNGKIGTLNDGLLHLHLAASTGDVDVRWVAFLDDNDTVSEQFVARVKDIDEWSVDVIVFRSQCPRDVVMPHPLYPALVPNEIGKGVVVRRAFAENHRLRFEAGDDPIAHFLTEAERAGARILLHPAISYFEKDTRPHG